MSKKVDTKRVRIEGDLEEAEKKVESLRHLIEQLEEEERQEKIEKILRGIPKKRRPDRLCLKCGRKGEIITIYYQATCHEDAKGHLSIKNPNDSKLYCERCASDEFVVYLEGGEQKWVREH